MNFRMNHYFILHSHSTEDLEDKVQYSMNDGYQPLGGMTIAPYKYREEYQTVFFQTMVGYPKLPPIGVKNES